VSAHYTIDEDGTVYGHVDEGCRAWHAGVGAWRGLSDINSHSIGIEIVNKGHEFGYHDFADAQIQAVIDLCQGVMTRHSIEPQSVIAHSDLAPMRKQDPGEKFPWELLAQNGVGAWPSVSSEDVVKASGIDVYQALHDFGYECEDKASMLIAFQRHFVPEVFEAGLEGTITSQTKSRLYALLAGHVLRSREQVAG